MKDIPVYFHWVFETTKNIPKGKVTTYGAIADYLALGSARMVGWALRHAGMAKHIPAHRVVNRIGELTGRHHFNPPERMEALLKQEGVEVIDHKIQNFKKHLWIPSEHMDHLEIDLT
jgi:methylated-DNA-protein-cysteine methyltransferase-like protein